MTPQGVATPRLKVVVYLKVISGYNLSDQTDLTDNRIRLIVTVMERFKQVYPAEDTHCD